MGFAIFFCHVPSPITGAVYHVATRGNARQDIVAGDQDCRLMRERLAHVIDRFSWHCHTP